MVYEKLENEMLNNLQQIKSIKIYTNGDVKTISKDEKIFLEINNKLKDLFSNSRIMPAFGVSLDENVKQEIQTDNWIELEYSQTQTLNGLSFDKLLFRLEECYGFNLIRNFNNSYNGRCIFIDLDKLTDLNELVD